MMEFQNPIQVTVEDGKEGYAFTSPIQGRSQTIFDASFTATEALSAIIGRTKSESMQAAS